MPIPPLNDLNSAIMQNLAPGYRTAIVRGVTGTTGVALVEADWPNSLLKYWIAL